MNDALIRLSRPSDINVLMSLDLRCYNYPYSLDEWRKLVNESGTQNAPRVVLIEFMGKEVGFALWTYGDKICKLLRLAVLENNRNLGLGTFLVRKCINDSKNLGMEKVEIIVPDVHCKPGDPDDISGFLQKLNFNASGNIIFDYQEMYGRLADGYVFERLI